MPPKNPANDPLDRSERVSRDRIRRIEKILDAALLLPEADRMDFVADRCGDDDALLEEVRSLLSSYGEASRWFDRFSAELVPDALNELEAALGQDRRVGPWRTLDRIGRGGMGSVYLAERGDGQYEQKVALKLIRRGMESEEAVRRFFAEREILARLEHPNIARLVDGGVTDDGLPWFAMELVEGEPIDRYCESREVPLRSRLELFLQVADAVAYLHRNLVVHRDLKPGNVLVTDEGLVKVVDFGIAKVLDGQGEAILTRTGSRPRTPRYAAPEQVEGGAVTTATDVYALGVLLYELLSESPVFDEAGHALERSILETDPAPPSAVAPEDRRRRLKGDLDTIVLKAIRKRPERRYASAEALAEDVRRHLAGRPVSARPDRVWYRTGKFVARHRAGVAAAMALLVLVLAFGAFATVQSNRLAHERDHALEISDLLVDIFSAADPAVARGDDLTARELVERGAETIQTELEGRPLLRADLLAVLGDTYWNLGLYEEAADLFEDALQARRSRLPENHPDIASAHYDVGRSLLEIADFDVARDHLEAALRIRSRSLGDENPATAVVLSELAHLHHQAGEFELADSLHRQAVRIHRAGGDAPALKHSLDSYGVFLAQRGQPAEAVPLHREALRIGRAVHGDDHPLVLRTLNNLATAHLTLGELDEAERMYRETIEVERRVHGPRHPDVSTPLANLGNLLLRLEGRELEAEAAHREALEIDRAHYGEDHPLVAQRYHQLALSLDALDRLEEAEALFRRAWETLRNALPEGHVNLAYPMVELGGLLIEQGRAAEAEPILREALQLRLDGFPPGHLRIAEAQSELGAALVETGRLPEAEPLLAAALEVMRSDPGTPSDLLEATRKRLERAVNPSSTNASATAP